MHKPRLNLHTLVFSSFRTPLFSSFLLLFPCICHIVVRTQVGAVCNADKTATIKGCVQGQLISVQLPADAANTPCQVSTELGKIFLMPVAYRMQC